MQCETRITNDGQCAHLRVNEDIVPAVARAVVAEMAKLQHQKNTRRFLLDVRGVSAKTTPTDDFQIANSEVTSFGFDPKTCVAVLKSPGDTSHDFIETVGRNAGQNIRLFEDMEVAVAWLRRGIFSADRCG